MAKKFSMSRILGYLLKGFIVLLLVYAGGRLYVVATDSRLSGDIPVYLQNASANAITLRWHSQSAYAATVRYGTDLQNLEQVVTEDSAVSDHHVRLQNLKPATRYYYQVHHNDTPVHAGNSYWFFTAPETGVTEPVRIWITGDQGLANENQALMRDAMVTWTNLHGRNNRPNIDLWITTGDNAYRSGSVAQFKQHFFTPFEPILRNVPVWPAYGNHDARRWSFFRLFNFPTQGEAGGVASGTEKYYSFDYGNVHIVMLDSQSSDMSIGAPMLAWLKKDLASTRQSWLIAIMHHPPYSSGSHHSDNPHDSAGRMLMIRENVLPLLEQHGVDMVISGHSHGYERSFFMLCNYMDSSQFNTRYIQDRVGYEVQEKLTYRKKAAERESLSGTIYMVVGSSARADEADYNHPVMPVSLKSVGSTVLDITGDKLTANFLTSEFTVKDRFHIVKNDPAAPEAKSSCDLRAKHDRTYFY